ncbi:MAG: hypothetical protein ACTHU0_11420 [Kofleriaceae bacterium]
MSDSKRTGSRDISELKQRLGLKKGAAAPATGQTRTNGGQSAGIAPPPGLNLPPPPGVQQPQQPVIPSAADDPFAAMNAMAAVGTVQRAPEIVIVNDGKPVESVGKSSMGATIAKIVVPAVLALGIGVGVGRISKDANFYNDGLKDAKAILGEPGQASTVRGVKKILSEIDSTLDEMKTKTNFRQDPAIDKQLDEIMKKIDSGVKADLVFRAKQNALDDGISGQVLSFYAGVAEIKGMLDAHVKSAKADEKALASGKAATEAAAIKDGENTYLAGQARYAILIQAPTEGERDDFGARVVEIGPVYCGDKISSAGKCDDGGPSAFGYRNEPGGTVWTKGDLVTQGSDSVPAKKLLPLLPNGTRDALIKGSEAGASEVYYTKRVRAISERTKKLITDANKLETALQAASSKGARFSFFL